MKALIIMSKTPIPGLAKTRLKGILSDVDCANLQMAMLKDLFMTTEKLKNVLDIFLFYTPKEQFQLMKNISPSYIKLYQQQGETIGDRMYNAAELLLKKYNQAIIIGSDIPEIDENIILDAFDKLKYCDAVIGPTYDGGYYLIGFKKLDKKVFDNQIPWGDRSVFELTLKNFEKCKFNYKIVQSCSDIDTKEDLIAFLRRNSTNIKAENTYKFLNSIGGSNGKGFNDREN